MTDPHVEHRPAQLPTMRQVTTRVAYKNPWLSVREDEFVRADGLRGTYGVVDKPDFSLIVAEDNGGFHMVEQFRYAIGRRSLEFPQGGFPPGKSGTALQLAQAELAEETGFRADQWRHLGHLHEAIGFCSQGYDIFHATGLTPGSRALEDTESDMTTRWVSEAEFITLVKAGEIVDGSTVTAYGMLKLWR
jgi:8-oxo-dGTP pyrophosphatase MutT (NUDIX family)